MMPATIAIIGMGHVGRIMHDLLRPHAQIITYDTAQAQDYPTRRLAACDAAIICVDTPMGDGGACDTSHVEEALGRLSINTVLLKSTIPPGTTDRLAATTGKQICYSPEYVGESTYQHPFWSADPRNVPFVIFGGKPPVRRRFIELFQPMLGPAKIYFQCSALEAELIKYMENAYLATKVTFVNEFRKICETFEADWHTVREGWLLDPRVGRAHSAAFANAPGFGGKCLPKDVNAIIRAAAHAGYSAALLGEVLRSNQRFSDEEHR